MLDTNKKDETIINNNSKIISLNLEIVILVVAILILFLMIKYFKQYINKKVRNSTIRNEINA